jgi:hypothetical protein
VTGVTDVDQAGRRSRLRSLKLQALVRDHLGGDLDAVVGAFPPGAVVLVDGTAWILVEDDVDRGLGPALAWALRNGAERLHVLADHDTGLLARRAGRFQFPIEVWHVADRVLLPAVAEPLGAPPAAAPQHLALLDTIRAGGADPVVEHGVVTGEVRGLEVCRVVDDPLTGAVRLEVGVGAHDREAFALIHGDVPTVDALAGVAHAVGEHRRPGADQHPLNRLVPERLVRWQLERAPELIGLAAVEGAEPPVPRRTVKERVPCVARGRRGDGSPVVLVCSVGVDLDLVPYAIDARLAPGVDGGEVWLIAPSRDLVPVTAELAGLADQTLSLVPFSG